jgi:hypothetical protein
MNKYLNKIASVIDKTKLGKTLGKVSKKVLTESGKKIAPYVAGGIFTVAGYTAHNKIKKKNLAKRMAKVQTDG